MIILGIDIGGTNFRIGAVNEKNELVKFEKVPVGTVFYSGDILSDLTSKIKSFGEDLDYTAVAIGFPATLNADRSRVVQAPNIPFMENLPVCDYLQIVLGLSAACFLRHSEFRYMRNAMSHMRSVLIQINIRSRIRA